MKDYLLSVVAEAVYAALNVRVVVSFVEDKLVVTIDPKDGEGLYWVAVHEWLEQQK